jgi:hypothetical protein
MRRVTRLKDKTVFANSSFLPSFSFSFHRWWNPTLYKDLLGFESRDCIYLVAKQHSKEFSEHTMIYTKLYASPLKPVSWKRSLYESFVWKISIVIIIIIIILYSYFYFILLSRRLPGISSVTFTQSKTISLSTYFITLRTCSRYATSLPLPLKPRSLHMKRFINFHLDAFISFLSFMFSSGFPHCSGDSC